MGGVPTLVADDTKSGDHSCRAVPKSKRINSRTTVGTLLLIPILKLSILAATFSGCAWGADAPDEFGLGLGYARPYSDGRFYNGFGEVHFDPSDELMLFADVRWNIGQRKHNKTLRAQNENQLATLSKFLELEQDRHDLERIKDATTTDDAHGHEVTVNVPNQDDTPNDEGLPPWAWALILGGGGAGAGAGARALLSGKQTQQNPSE